VFFLLSGDNLVVDRAVEAVDGKIVIAVVNGELTVKRLAIAGCGMRDCHDSTPLDRYSHFYRH
jgi:SOS-response transcriptional repressor LexA